MLRFKYIIVDDGDIYLPIIFSCLLQHNKVASFAGKTVISAGFVQFKGDEILCSGNSVSLRVVSRGETDAALIKEDGLRDL